MSLFASPLSTIFGAGQRWFGKCLRCKHRFVSLLVDDADGVAVMAPSLFGDLPGVSGAALPVTRRMAGTATLVRPPCPKCFFTLIEWFALKASFRAGVRCDARCTAAVGPDCVCSCAGANHGCGA